jgi:hypothetical protein
MLAVVMLGVILRLRGRLYDARWFHKLRQSFPPASWTLKLPAIGVVTLVVAVTTRGSGVAIVLGHGRQS